MQRLSLIDSIWNIMNNKQANIHILNDIQKLLGNEFKALVDYVNINQKDYFSTALQKILKSNKEIVYYFNNLENKNFHQMHSGIGDNIGRDKIVNYFNSINNESLNINVLFNDELTMLYPIHNNFDNNIIITVFNNGSTNLHIISIGVEFINGLKALFPNYQTSQIDVAEAKTWIIPINQLVDLKTNQFVNGIEIVKKVLLDISLVQAIWIKTHSGTIERIEKEQWIN